MKGTKSPFARSKCVDGMVYAMPLVDGSYCYAQAISSSMSVVVNLAVFKVRTTTLLSSPPDLLKHDAIAFTATWRRSLNRGDWAALGVHALIVEPTMHPNEMLEDSNGVGVTHSDLGLITNFMNAWFGLEPWNVWYDEQYFDRLLGPGIARPSTAVVLSKEDRDAYRTPEWLKG
jgi:hypothetical protein